MAARTCCCLFPAVCFLVFRIPIHPDQAMLEIDFLDDLVQDKRHQTFTLSPYHQHIIRTSFEQMIDHPPDG